MLPHTDEGDSMLVAERLRQAAISLPVTVEGIGPVPVTVSFGVATSQDGAESGSGPASLAPRSGWQAGDPVRH